MITVLAAAKGSPGVTATTVALAVAWPNPVLLVEADPCGASGVLPGYLGGQVRHDHGVLDAAVAARAGTLGDALDSMTIPLGGSARLLAGLTRPGQATTMAVAWADLAPALADHARDHDLDLLIDAGRLGTIGFPTPMLGLADRVLLVTRTDLASLHATRAWAGWVADQLVDRSRAGLVLIGAGQPYEAREISTHLGVPVTAIITWDPDGARVYATGGPTPRRAVLPRSITAAVHTLTTTTATGGPR